jgi:hypothetical protein
VEDDPNGRMKAARDVVMSMTTAELTTWAVRKNG